MCAKEKTPSDAFNEVYFVACERLPPASWVTKRAENNAPASIVIPWLNARASRRLCATNSYVPRHQPVKLPHLTLPATIEMPEAPPPPPLATYTDCAVCDEGYTLGFSSCHKCQGERQRSSLGVFVAVLILLLLVVTLILAGLVQVVDIQPDEEELRQVWKRKLTTYRTFLFNMFPRTAIRIVVVVWQIVTQVLLVRVWRETARGQVRTVEYAFNVRDENIFLYLRSVSTLKLQTP